MVLCGVRACVTGHPPGCAHACAQAAGDWARRETRRRRGRGARRMGPYTPCGLVPAMLKPSRAASLQHAARTERCGARRSGAGPFSRGYYLATRTTTCNVPTVFNSPLVRRRRRPTRLRLGAAVGDKNTGLECSSNVRGA